MPPPSYLTTQVQKSPGPRPQQTHNMMSAMHELTYKKDVRTKTHQKNMMAMASHHPKEEASQQKGEGADRDDPLRHMRVSSADEHQRTNQEDVQNKPYQETGSCVK